MSSLIPTPSIRSAAQVQDVGGKIHHYDKIDREKHEVQYWEKQIHACLTLLMRKKYMNVDFVNEGGWHSTSIKKPKDIHYKLSNFMHHLEYEESGLNISDMERMVKEKKILYDHKADQKKEKYTGNQTLKKVSNKILPDYILSNLSKYKEWLD